MLDLISADYTFLNERLARHYGIPNVYGSHFRRVALTDENRKGFLGQGSILTVTSYATRTAPSIRGKWLLENILGTPPPPPPPNVPELALKAAATASRRRCGSRWKSIAPTRLAPAATNSWTRSASRWRTSTRPASGAPRMAAARSMRPASRRMVSR